MPNPGTGFCMHSFRSLTAWANLLGHQSENSVCITRWNVWAASTYYRISSYTWSFQAVSRWLPTAVRIRSYVKSCEICGGQSVAGAGFLRVLRFPLPILTPPIAPQSPSSIIWGWNNRPVVAAVPSGLILTPLRIIKNNTISFQIFISEISAGVLSPISSFAFIKYIYFYDTGEAVSFSEQGASF
jgi:hypothetical protein